LFKSISITRFSLLSSLLMSFVYLEPFLEPMAVDYGASRPIHWPCLLRTVSFRGPRYDWTLLFSTPPMPYVMSSLAPFWEHWRCSPVRFGKVRDGWPPEEGHCSPYWRIDGWPERIEKYNTCGNQWEHVE